MTTKEIIKETKAILADLLDNKITYNESLNMMEQLSKESNTNFSIIYNAFYSSEPEIYF